ncbi:DNA-3-methyladenine glycosylase [Streptomyces sp. S1D4-11]|nr:DNA-3-methyladenine glycosylase 2 family protein [Streptomyces sp. S1D4-11]QIZ00784.1 DNA-3-methyladenine glycosylase 2 family protein [Streptomyces sp. S1D4-11]
MNAIEPRLTRANARQAALLLARQDAVIARLTQVIGFPVFSHPTDTPFAALVRTIIQQQLGAAAAHTIHTRLVAALDDQVTPERLLALPGQTLREAGLSDRKVASLHDLAAKTLNGDVTLDSGRLAEQSDETVTAQLTAVRGIGLWSAQIFLMFQLHRPNIWPTGDLAMRRGFAYAWGVPTPTAERLQRLGEPFRPFRSVVAWYSWQAGRLKPDMTAPHEPPSEASM